MSIRTFVAVAASPEVRSRATQLVDLLRAAADGVKWVEPQNLHWTLQFLGEVDDKELPAVCDAVTAAVADVESFALSAVGAGAFPSADRPRTLWIGASNGAEDMVAMQQRIEQSLGTLGFGGENRRYVPHLTLGRAGRQTPSDSLSELLTELADYEAGITPVDEVTIYASRLRREGPDYQILGRAPLTG